MLWCFHSPVFVMFILGRYIACKWVNWWRSTAAKVEILCNEVSPWCVVYEMSGTHDVKLQGQTFVELEKTWSAFRLANLCFIWHTSLWNLPSWIPLNPPFQQFKKYHVVSMEKTITTTRQGLAPHCTVQHMAKRLNRQVAEGRCYISRDVLYYMYVHVCMNVY